MKSKKTEVNKTTEDQESHQSLFSELMARREDKLRQDAYYELFLREFIVEEITHCPCCIRTLYDQEKQEVIDRYLQEEKIPSEIEILESLIFSYPEKCQNQEKNQSSIH
jgi:hypothetical protein